MADRVEMDEHGREIPDSQSLRMPLGFKRPETLAEQVQRLVRNGLSMHAQAQGAETFEEADDFDIDDDPPDPSSPFEAQFDPVLGREVTLDELVRNRDHMLRQYDLAMRRAAANSPETADQPLSSPSKEGPAKAAESGDAGGGT